MQKNIVVGIFLILLFVFFFFLLKNDTNVEDYKMKIYFFKAGKADAIVITEGDSTIMIDTGEESLSEEILSYFKQNKITKLDYLIISHFDKDHVGSASTILDTIEVKQVLQSNVPKDSEYYLNYLNSLEKKNITPITVSGNLEFSLGDLSFLVNGPTTIYDKSESNNSSLIVGVTYQDKSFLFTGDIENKRIKDYVSMNTTAYDFLKVPYHGHYQKRLEELLDNVQPQYAVITSSDKETEDEATLELLRSKKISYYLTRKGALTIYCDGNHIQVKQ